MDQEKSEAQKLVEAASEAGEPAVGGWVCGWLLPQDTAIPKGRLKTLLGETVGGEPPSSAARRYAPVLKGLVDGGILKTGDGIEYTVVDIPDDAGSIVYDGDRERLLFSGVYDDPDDDSIRGMLDERAAVYLRHHLRSIAQGWVFDRGGFQLLHPGTYFIPDQRLLRPSGEEEHVLPAFASFLRGCGARLYIARVPDAASFQHLKQQPVKPRSAKVPSGEHPMAKDWPLGSWVVYSGSFAKTFGVQAEVVGYANKTKPDSPNALRYLQVRFEDKAVHWLRVSKLEQVPF